MAPFPLSPAQSRRRGALTFAAVAAVPVLLLALGNALDRPSHGTAWVLPAVALFVVAVAVGGAFGAAIGAASSRGAGRRVVVLALLFPLVACLAGVGAGVLLGLLVPGEGASSPHTVDAAVDGAFGFFVLLMVYVFVPLLAASGVVAKDLYLRARPRTP